MTDRDQEIARLQAQLRQLEIARSAERLASIPAFQIGDQARVIADSRAGRKSPRVGDVGTVVAVYPKAESMLVYGNCVATAYLLDFGPDAACCDGRDTWAFADGDLATVEGAARKRKKR